jgi:glycosyltransferase involved in cell wall biosynthesis
MRTTSRVVMLLENNPYPQDVRVRLEAQSLTRAGYRVTVIAPRAAGQTRRESIAGVRVRRFHTVEGQGVGGFLAEYLLAAVRLNLAGLRDLLTGAEVLHLHNPPDVFFPLGAAFRLAGRKVVFDHHDLFPETLEVKLGLAGLGRLARACERATYRVANHVLATNESYAEIARTRGGKGSQEVTVVRNGPPEEWLDLSIVSRPGPLNRIQLGYVGAVSRQDGVEGLVPVLARLRESEIEANLLVIGDGDARAALEAGMRRHGLSDRLTITGWTPWERVPELLADADICVDPAPATLVNHRSTMIKIAEYLALGKPVVAFDLLESRRTAGEAAVFVPPGDSGAFADAVAALARDPSRRSELGRLARERAGRLTWPHSERALLRAYERLLASRRSGADIIG